MGYETLLKDIKSNPLVAADFSLRSEGGEVPLIPSLFAWVDKEFPLPVVTNH
jgi:hypothetical protein